MRWICRRKFKLYSSQAVIDEFSQLPENGLATDSVESFKNGWTNT